MAVAVAVGTAAVVVRQLVRENAIAHAVFVPWYHIKLLKGIPRKCVLNESHIACRAAVQQPSIHMKEVLKIAIFVSRDR